MNRITTPKANYEVGYIKPPVPRRVWEQVNSKLARALENGGPLTVNDLLESVNNDQAFMLVAYDGDDPSIVYAATIAEVERWPGREVLTVVATGGRNFEGWIEQMQWKLEDLADMMGCEAIRAICRPGMGKWLKNIGYKPVLETLEYRHGREEQKVV